MPISLKPLPVLALLAWAGPLAAQDETPEAPAEEPAAEAPAEAAPEDEAAAPDSGLDMGEPVDGEPRPGEPYVREEFGDWSLQCLRVEDGPEPCQLSQLLLDDQGNAVAEISVFRLPEGGQAVAGANIVTPLETLLTEGLTISVDGAEAKKYPFTLCNRAGCVARVGFTAEDVEQLKQGDAAQLSIVPAAAPDQRVDLTISLSGFTAGFDSSSVPNPNAPEAEPEAAPAE
jgi:invasion protein IalB